MWFIGTDKDHPVHITKKNIMPGSEFMGLGVNMIYTVITDLITLEVTCFSQLHDAITTLYEVKRNKECNHIWSDYETEINPENPKEISLDIIDDLKLFEVTDAKEYTGKLFPPTYVVI